MILSFPVLCVGKVRHRDGFITSSTASEKLFLTLGICHEPSDADCSEQRHILKT